MLEPLDQRLGQVADLPAVAERRVPLEHGDDLVVRLVAVDQAQPADRHRLQEDVAVREGPLRKDADVQGIGIPLDHRSPCAARSLRPKAATRSPQKVWGMKP